MWGLSASLSLNFVLPALDHHAAEYSPFHAHLVVGALTTAEREQALAAHQHGGGQPHTHPASAAVLPMTGETPVVYATGLWESLLALGAGGVPELRVRLDWPVPPPLYAVWLVLLPAALCLVLRSSPPPIQPPRPA